MKAAGERQLRPASCRTATTTAAARIQLVRGQSRGGVGREVPAAPTPTTTSGGRRSDRTSLGRAPLGSCQLLRPPTAQVESFPYPAGRHAAAVGSTCAATRRTSSRSCAHSAVSIPTRIGTSGPMSRTTATTEPCGRNEALASEISTM